MNLRVTIFLIAVGVAIGVVVWVNPFSSSPEEEPDAPWFYQVSETDIDTIEVRHRGERVRFLRDEERNWQFEGLTGVAPRRERWGGMVLILTGPRSRRLLQEQIDNPAQYGLSTPETEVRVKLSDGRDINVLLGDLTTDGKHHYGQVAGFNQLFLITSTWGEVLSRLVREPPLPKWFVQREPDDNTGAEHHQGRAPRGRQLLAAVQDPRRRMDGPASRRGHKVGRPADGPLAGGGRAPARRTRGTGGAREPRG